MISKKLLRFLVFILLFLLLILYFSRDLVSEQHYMDDESLWIGASNLYFKLAFLPSESDFITLKEIFHSFEKASKSDNFAHQGGELELAEIFCLNPPVALYFIGSGLHLKGYHEEYSNYVHYDYKYSLQWNVEHGTAPGRHSEARSLARIPTTIVSALGAVALFFLALQLLGPFSALVCLFLYTFNPLVWRLARLAMTDAYAASFSILFMWILVFIFQRLGNKKTWRNVLLCFLAGFFIATAAGCKLTALTNFVVLVGIFISVAFYVKWFEKINLDLSNKQGSLAEEINAKSLFKYLIAVFFSAWLIFYISNPYLYSAPITKFTKIWQGWKAYRERARPYMKEGLEGPKQTFLRIYYRLFQDSDGVLVKEYLYPEDRIDRLIKGFADSNPEVETWGLQAKNSSLPLKERIQSLRKIESLLGRKKMPLYFFGNIGKKFGFSWDIPLLMLGLIFINLVLFNGLRKKNKDFQVGKFLCLISIQIWFLLTFAATILFYYVDWEKYLLPLVAPLTLIQAASFKFLEIIFKEVRKKIFHKED